MGSSDAIKPHAIMVEYFFQGHITPFLHFAVALASKGCTVTYVRTEFFHHLMPDSLLSEARESGLDIRCMTISDGFPLDSDRRRLASSEFYGSLFRHFPERVDELVGKIVAEGEGGLRLRPFLVADTMYLWPPAVAAKYGILNVSFCSTMALQLSIGHHLELLKEDSPFKILGEHKVDLLDVPGVKASSIRDNMEWRYNDEAVSQRMRECIMKACLQLKKADFLLCNTVQELECEALSGLNQKLPTYAIGPTNVSANSSSSLRPPTDCAEWLSAKPPRSVIYVSFGSITPVFKEVVVEIARGLKMSGAYFLFVLRTDQPWNDDPAFVTDRGLVVPWCNQCEVLAHPAIGGFLTHCGWNSVLESMFYGVPFICYPLIVDHPLIRNLIVDDCKIGINLCDREPLSKEEVAEKVAKFMSCKDELRLEMEKVSKDVRGALAVNGSSDRNLDKFIKDLKDKICT